MLLAMFFWGPIISLVFYYMGKRNNKIGEKQFINKIHRLEDKVEVLREEKAALIEENREDTT
jgi:hypothetical protein